MRAPNFPKREHAEQFATGQTSTTARPMRECASLTRSCPSNVDAAVSCGLRGKCCDEALIPAKPHTERPITATQNTTRKWCLRRCIGERGSMIVEMQLSTPMSACYISSKGDRTPSRWWRCASSITSHSVGALIVPARSSNSSIVVSAEQRQFSST